MRDAGIDQRTTELTLPSRRPRPTPQVAEPHHTSLPTTPALAWSHRKLDGTLRRGPSNSHLSGLPTISTDVRSRPTTPSAGHSGLATNPLLVRRCEQSVLRGRQLGANFLVWLNTSRAHAGCRLRALPRTSCLYGGSSACLSTNPEQMHGPVQSAN